MSDYGPRRLTRRRFLQAAGGGAGLAALSPLVGAGLAAGASAATGVRLKVGVMAPSGGEYAAMGANLVDGLRLGLQRSGVAASVTPLEVPLGFSGATSAATRLLDEARVDAVVAGITAPVAGSLVGLFEERGVPLVVANVGAHVVRPADRSPAVLHVSLGYWQASFAMGRWAAANAGRTALVATSLADSGYDAVYAFRRGFESAGGRLLDTVVTHEDPDAAGLEEVAAAFRRTGTQVVHALYSGSRATEALRSFRSAGIAASQLTAGAFAVDESLLGRLGSVAVGLRSAFSWTPALATQANRSFARAYRAATGRSPDAFAVLGNDAGTLVATGAARAAADGSGVRGLIAALGGQSVASPRGSLQVDAGSGTVLTPLYVREVRSVNGRLRNVSLGQTAAVTAFPQELSGLETSLASGYINEYLCPA